MKQAILGLLILVVSLQQGYASIEKLEVNAAKAPVFIMPLITLIFSVSKNEEQKQELVEQLRLLNKNLESYPSNSTKAFFMSEFFKNFLQLEKNSMIQTTYSEISVKNLATAQKKLKDSSLVISKMSEFLLVEIFLSYQSQIDKANKKEKLSFQKVNRYLGSWVEEFLKRTPAEFDSLVAIVSKNYLASMAEISKLMLFHGPNLASKSPIFSKLEEIQIASNPLDTKTELEEVLDDETEVSLPEIEPTEGATEHIDALIDKVEDNN